MNKLAHPLAVPAVLAEKLLESPRGQPAWRAIGATLFRCTFDH
jgi:hypothetical protein